jgi:hypothetical protein
MLCNALSGVVVGCDKHEFNKLGSYKFRIFFNHLLLKLLEIFLVGLVLLSCVFCPLFTHTGLFIRVVCRRSIVL